MKVDSKLFNADKTAALNAYIKEKHTQEECIGFIDGYEKASIDMNGIIDYIVWIPIFGFCYALYTDSLILLYKGFYKWHFVWSLIFLILL